MEPEDIARLLGPRADDLGADEIARKAHARVGRKQVEAAVALFTRAAEVAKSRPAWTDQALDYEALAALVLADAGMRDEASARFEALLARGYRGYLLRHVHVQRLLGAAARRDAREFARGFRELAAADSFPPDTIDRFLEPCADLGLWQELGTIVGSAEERYGSLPRKLARQVAAVVGRVPDQARAAFDQAKARAADEGMRRRAEAARSVVARPVLARKPSRTREHLREAPTHSIARGIFFALTRETLRTLRGSKGDAKRRAFVATLEERWEAAWVCETDKAWRYLALLLADPRTDDANIEPFFGKRLHRARYHHINLLDGLELNRVASALEAIDRGELHRRYETWSTRELHDFLGVSATPPFDYLAETYERMRGFLRRAAAGERAVVFDADA